MNPRSYSSLLNAALRKLPEAPVTSFGPDDFLQKCGERRCAISQDVLGFPSRTPVIGKVMSRLEREHYTIEKLLIRVEERSWLTAHLYLPRYFKGRLPLVLMAPGHGGSKSHGYMPVGGQIYAQLGFAAFVADPLGEEERNWPCGIGARGHREHHAVDRLNRTGRPFLGKVVYDLIASLDYLVGRADLDPERIACVGSSMGGTVAQLVGALEQRIRATLVSSWVADYHCLSGHYGCCFRLPGLIRHANQIDLLALAIPHSKVLVCSGTDDEVTPPEGLQEMVKPLERWANAIGRKNCFDCRIEEAGGHRPYYLMRHACEWIFEALDVPQPAGWANLRERTLGSLLSEAGCFIAPLYDQERHHRGTLIPRLPIEFLPPEDLQILTEETMASLGLERSDFTLEGFLNGLSSPPLEQIERLPEGLAPRHSSARIRKSLSQLVVEPDWLSMRELSRQDDRSLPGLIIQNWEFSGMESGFSIIGSPHAFAREKDVTLLLTRSNEPWKAMPSLFDERLVVVPKLVRYDDNETLLGTSALLVNLLLLSRISSHFRAQMMKVTRLISEVPRLGELLIWREVSIRHFHLLAEKAVEEAPVGNGRVESILPGTPDLHWIDLFLARPDCEMALPESYFTPEAWQQLSNERIVD